MTLLHPRWTMETHGPWRLTNAFANVVACGVLLLAIPSGMAAAQSQSAVTELQIGDMTLRVPREYFSLNVDAIGRNASKATSQYWMEAGRLHGHGLSFEFWISDAKPLASEMRNLSAFSHPRVGIGHFWPPEAGRARLSGDEFLVHVVEVAPRDVDSALRGQLALRPKSMDSKRSAQTFGSLTCGVDQNNVNHVTYVCSAPIDADPMVYISGSHVGDPQADYSSMRMYLYSRADGLNVRIDFPDQGLPRWQEIICKTLSLFRSWRASDGPPPMDCSRLPRLSRMTSDNTPRG